MLRGGFIISAVAATVAVAAPAAAQAADYTVDSGAAAGCSADKVCKTLTDAVAAVGAGDVITVKPGSYTEPGKVVVADANLTIKGTAGSTTVTFPAAATAGDAGLTLGDGTTVEGLSLVTGTDAGPAVLAAGKGAKIVSTAIARLAASSANAPAIQVAGPVASGTTTVDRVTILNGVGTGPAILGNETSSLALMDTLIFSGAGQGAPLALVGNDVAAGEPVPNTVTRSSLIAGNPSADALTFTSGAASAVKKGLKIDSAVLVAGSNGAGVRAVSAYGGGLPTDTSGDIAISVVHATVVAGARPFVVEANARGGSAKGNITLAFDRSIVHGAGDGTVKSFVPDVPALPLPLPLPLPSVGGVANSAAVTIKQSDTATPNFTGNGGNATITRSGTISNTPDAQLFANPARNNYALRADAPVIDKGGPLLGGESVKDVNGDDRTGLVTDLGADEFVNRAPTAAASAPASARQRQTITLDGSASRDPDAGDGIATYKWNFGDGQTAETTTPTTTHAYAPQGIFRPTLTVVDRRGASSALVQFGPIVVGDGTSPTLTLSQPSRNGSFAITVSSKVGNKIKRVFDKALLKKIVFAGKASDQSGISLVLLSVKRLALGNRAVPANPKACVFLGTNKTTFRTASCKKPVFFSVPHKDGAFSYNLNSKVRPKAGKYQLAVVAVDKVGVFSNAFTVNFTLK